MIITYRLYYTSGNQKLFMVREKTAARCKSLIKKYCLENLAIHGEVYKIEVVEQHIA